MISTPCILISTAEHAVALSRVLEAQGRGSDTFVTGRRLVPAGNGDAGPVVAYFAQDMSATADLEAAWRAFAASGDLPEIPHGVWGEDGIISAAEAMAARVGLTVHSVAGAVPNDWAASVLAAHGLEFWPDPEI